MKKYRVDTHDRNGKKIQYYIDSKLFTTELARNFRSGNVVNRECYGETTITRLYKNGKEGRPAFVW